MKKQYLFNHIGFLILLVLITLNAQQAAAQSQIKPYRVAAGIGYSFTGYRDEVESSINRYLNTFTFMINGNIEKNNFLHSFNIDFFTGSPKMPAPYRGYRQKSYNSTRVGAEYAFDCRLWGNDILPGHLGGAFRAIFHYTGVDFTNPGVDVYDFSAPTGVGLVSLNIHISQKWNINARNTLVFSTGYPLIGYAVRPPYAGYDDLWGKYLEEKTYLKIVTLGEFISFHNYRAFYGDLKYHYKVSALFSPYSGISFEYSRMDSPPQRPRIDAIFRINTGIAFTF